MRPGNGASVLEYVRDLDRAFAIPILGVSEYPGCWQRNWGHSTHRRAIFGWFSTRR
jgi:hypothetical protein